MYFVKTHTGVMNAFYIVRDLEGVWPKAYKTFAEALGAVQDRINTANEEYKKTPDYAINGCMDAGSLENDWHKGDVKKGVLVANVHDYDEQYFIQELTF